MIQRSTARAATITQLALLFAACTPMGNNPPAESGATTSVTTGLTAEQRAGGWRALFDGSSTAGWRGYKTQTMPAGWRIVDGVLTKSGPVDDLVTRGHFGNFRLALGWKHTPCVNAG